MPRCLSTLIALVAVVIVPSAITGCSINPATGDRQLMLVPDAQVQAMGASAAPQLTQEYGGEVQSPQLRAYVNRVGNALAAQVEPAYQQIDWTFTVLDSDVINAFALPGGRVFISKGLLQRFTNEAQVAGVLGHEIGHVTAKHVNERVSQSMAIELGVAAIGHYSESQLATAAASMFGNGYQLHFGRSQESQSDELGVRYMVRAGYNPRGMLQVLDVLREASEGGQRQPEFLSTHPYPETRLETINGLLAGEYKQAANDPALTFGEARFAKDAAPYLK
ncbi:MAG: M48 family metallopeptidase [Phycisphaerales bacterium]|nr:M48 family metallopeptidase [Phycisphaerales bacterium]